MTGGAVRAVNVQGQLPEVLAHADRLYEENKMPEALAYLQQFDHQEAELLWRLARLCYKVSVDDCHKKERLSEYQLNSERNFADVSTSCSTLVFRAKVKLT